MKTGTYKLSLDIDPALQALAELQETFRRFDARLKYGFAKADPNLDVQLVTKGGTCHVVTRKKRR